MGFSRGSQGWNERLDDFEGAERRGGTGGRRDVDSERDVLEGCGGVEEEGVDFCEGNLVVCGHLWLVMCMMNGEGRVTYCLARNSIAASCHLSTWTLCLSRCRIVRNLPVAS